MMKKVLIMINSIMIEVMVLSACAKSTPTVNQLPTVTQVPTALIPTPTQGLGIGSTQISPKDGMTMVYVSAGEFLMGSPQGVGQVNEHPQQTINLDAYWIDQTEVTNAMFLAFINDTNYQTQAEKDGQSEIDGVGKVVMLKGVDWKHPQGPSSSLVGFENYPVEHITLFDAAAYCSWAGRNLPTETQWEKAARGTNGQTYPWGNTPPTGNIANIMDINYITDNSDKSINDSFKFTAPVGSYPDGKSPYGALDMAGNVFEWAVDGMDTSYSENWPSDNHAVLRGGSYANNAEGIRTAFRVPITPLLTGPAIGFRCALPLSPTKVNMPPSKTISTPAITPEITKTSDLPVINGTNMPCPLTTITADNADDLTHLASFQYKDIVNGIQNLAFTPSDTIDVISNSDRLVRLLALDGTISKTIGPLPAHEGLTYKLLKVSKDGTHLVVAESYFNPPVMYYPYHFQTAIYMRNLEDETDQQDAFLSAGIPAFTEDLSTLALLHNWEGNTLVEMWRFNEKTHKQFQDITTSGIKNVVISADGSIIATDYGNSIIIWQTKDGKRMNTLKSAGLPWAFSDDGRLLVSQTNKFINIWSIADKTLLQSIPYTGWVNKVTFSPNSQVIAAAIKENVFLWNVSDGKLIKTLTGDYDKQIFTNSVVFSPDGKYIAYDRLQTIEVWGIAKDGLNWSNNPQTPLLTQESDKSRQINIGDFTVMIGDVQLSDIGWNPFGLDSNFALVVNVSEGSGKLDEIKSLAVWFSDDKGTKFKYQASEQGVDINGNQTLNWNVWMSKPANGYLLHFPTGEVFDLTPLLK
jgi:formylglycine-generating enzyme required for sulfatase activity/WD40 repeat protein